MEGIAGVIHGDSHTQDNLIQPMLDVQRHRGKKGKNNCYSSGLVKIGTTGGIIAQNNQQTLAVVCDGYLYNHAELQKELENERMLFNSNTLSELVLNAYSCWGVDAFAIFNGDFALCIVDQRKQKIILARDKVGKKPLYWYHDNHTFLFSSELKALLATGIIPKAPALDALASFLHLGYIPQDMTGILNVNKLLPAHYLEYNFEGNKSVSSYWSYSSCFKGHHPKTLSTVTSEIKSMLTQSVKSNIKGLVRPCCFLSQGLGSMELAHLIHQDSKFNSVKFISGMWETQQTTESKENSLRNFLNIDPEICTLKNHLIFSDLLKIVWHLDEPNADPLSLLLWKLFETASSFSDGVITGSGSDELFAEHTRYQESIRSQTDFWKLIDRLSLKASQILVPAFSLINRSLALYLLKHLKTSHWQNSYLTRIHLMDQRTINDASPRLKKLFAPDVFIHKFYSLNTIESFVSCLLYFDMKTSLPDSSLIQYERISGAFGMEWRTPFLTNEIIEYLAHLPEPFYTDNSVNKSYLAATLEQSIPSNIVSKARHSKPNYYQLLALDPNLKNIFSLLTSGMLVDTGFINREWLIRTIDTSHINPHAVKHLYAVTVLEIWYRLFINRAIEPYPPTLSIADFLQQPF